MHHITRAARPLMHRPELLIVLAILGACLAVLMLAVGWMLLATLSVPVDGPLLAPFRWPPNHVGLA